MAETRDLKPFHWTPQTDRHARILYALGHKTPAVAEALGCNRTTLTDRLGNPSELDPIELEDVLSLLERYDAERNILEVLNAKSGSVEQSRLRSSLRTIRSAMSKDETVTDPVKTVGEMSDDELCADLERLVGCKITIKRGV